MSLQSKYQIFQMKKEYMHDYGFVHLELFRRLTKQSKGIDLNMYNKVYMGNTVKSSDNDLVVLERLFEQFNLHRPADFQGHSMSIGDIVKLGRTYYYCDSMGFKKISVANVETVKDIIVELAPVIYLNRRAK